MDEAIAVTGHHRWRAGPVHFERWEILEATRGGQLISDRGSRRPFGPLVHHTSAPLVVGNELWLADGGLWRVDLGTGLGTRCCERPMVPIDRQRAHDLGADVAGDEATAELGTALVADPKGQGVFTVAAAPDGAYHLLHVNRRGELIRGSKLCAAWPVLSAGGEHAAAIGFRGDLAVQSFEGALLAEASAGHLRVRAGLKAPSTKPSAQVIAAALSSKIDTGVLALAFADGVVLWSWREDKVEALTGVRHGGALTFAEGDRTLWMVQDGQVLVSLDRQAHHQRIEVALDRKFAMHDQVMVVAPPLVSQDGRLVLAEFAYQTRRTAAEKAALGAAMAKNRVALPQAPTDICLHKVTVLLDRHRYVFAQLDAIDLARSIWVAPRSDGRACDASPLAST